jgi:hypothetical protein
LLATDEKLSRQRYRLSLGRLLTPIRLSVSLAVLILTTSLFLGIRQAPERIDEFGPFLGFFSGFGIVVALGITLVCSLERIPEDEQEQGFDEHTSFIAEQRQMRWHEKAGVAVFFGGFLSGLLAILTILFGIFNFPLLYALHWLMGSDGTRVRLAWGFRGDAPLLSEWGLHGARFLDEAARNAPLGSYYLRPQWPWLASLICGACLAVMIMGWLFLAYSGRVQAAKRAYEEGLVPIDYPAFLAHATRLTFLQRSQGRWTFTHETIRRFFVRRREQYEREWRAIVQQG